MRDREGSERADFTALPRLTAEPVFRDPEISIVPNVMPATMRLRIGDLRVSAGWL